MRTTMHACSTNTNIRRQTSRKCTQTTESTCTTAIMYTNMGVNIHRVQYTGDILGEVGSVNKIDIL